MSNSVEGVMDLFVKSEPALAPLQLEMGSSASPTIHPPCTASPRVSQHHCYQSVFSPKTKSVAPR